MVGRRDDHRVDVVVVEQGPEVAVAAGGAARECDGLVAPAAVDLGDGHDAGVGLIPEVEDVPLADQAEADEAQAHAVVGPQDPPVSRGREGRGGSAPEQRSPAQHAACLAESDIASNSRSGYTLEMNLLALTYSGEDGPASRALKLFVII